MAGEGRTPEVREAKRLFLYGAGDGVRILKVERLAEMAGCHVATIRRHLPAWESECEQIISGTSENGLNLALSAETLANYRKDLSFIRNLAESAQIDLKTLGDTVALLRSFVAEFRAAGADKDSIEAALSVLSAWSSTSAKKQALESHALALQKRWQSMAGIDSLQTVAETREKTLATGRAKLQLRAEDGEAGKGEGGSGATPASGRGGVFAKRASVVDVQEDIDLGEL